METDKIQAVVLTYDRESNTFSTAEGIEVTEVKKGDKFVFYNAGDDFCAYRIAEAFCKKFGYSYGSMAQDMRIGIKKGGAYIAKWYNLATEDIKKLDGYIDGCYREGSVQVVFFS